MVSRKWQLLISVGGALLLAPQSGIPADNSVQFSGTLEAVTHHTLSIRLEDGRIVDARIPEDGELSAQSLFAKYRMGDLVEIKGQPVKPANRDFPFRDEETGVIRNLDLRQINLVRKPSPAELAVALGSRSRLIKQNLLAVPGQGDEQPVSLKSLRPPEPAATPPKKRAPIQDWSTRELLSISISRLCRISLQMRPRFSTSVRPWLRRSGRLWKICRRRRFFMVAGRPQERRHKRAKLCGWGDTAGPLPRKPFHVAPRQHLRL